MYFAPLLRASLCDSQWGALLNHPFCNMICIALLWNININLRLPSGNFADCFSLCWWWQIESASCKFWLTKRYITHSSARTVSVRGGECVRGGVKSVCVWGVSGCRCILCLINIYAPLNIFLQNTHTHTHPHTGTRTPTTSKSLSQEGHSTVTAEKR